MFRGTRWPYMRFLKDEEEKDNEREWRNMRRLPMQKGKREEMRIVRLIKAKAAVSRHLH